MSNVKNFGIVGVGNDVQFGKNGSRVVMNGSAFHFRNAQDNDFVDIKAKNLVVSGDLTVQGGTTELQTEIIKVEDKNIQLGVLANGAVASDVTAQGGGITLMGTTDKTIAWDAAGGGEWKSSESMDLDLGKAYRINGVDILSSTTLGGSVVNSSLTSVGTLVGLNVGGNVSVNGTVTAFGASEAGKTVKIGSSGELITAAGNVFDNITISGNTISSTNANGPIVLAPNGTGEVQVSGAKITGLADGVISSDAATVGQMSAAVSGETARAMSAESALQSSVVALQATDVTHTSQIAGLTADLASEVSRATAAEGALSTSVSAIQTTVAGHTTQIAGLTSDLAAEVSRATTAETALSASVSAVQTTVAGLATELASEVSRAVAAENAISATVSTHTTQIAGLTSDLAAEVSRATAAENALSGRVSILEAKKTSLNVVGTGLSYVQGTETLTLASTAVETGSTIVARDVNGASSFANIYDKGLAAQKVVFADATGLLQSASGVSVSNDGSALTIGQVTISGTQISVAGGALDVNGATIANVGTPVAGSDAVPKSYVDTAIAAVTVPNIAHAVYKAFGTSAETLVGTVTGFVHRIKVYVGSAYTAGATVTVGITGAASDLVANADLDAEAAGIYSVEIGKMYATPTDIKVFVAGAMTGAGTVVVEYL
jgi:predicted  nucleic acid-binding Zn-ribbon protein